MTMRAPRPPPSPAAATTAPATTIAAVTIPATIPATTGGEQPAEGDVAEITVPRGRATAGPTASSTVRLGQEVVITLQSDQDEEYHLHDYDLTQKAAAGVEATLSFVADKPGRFELESHVTDEVLLVLEVQ